MPKLAEVGEKAECVSKRAFSAVEAGVNNLLAQELTLALNQVQFEREERQKHLHQGLGYQLLGQFPVALATGVAADDVNPQPVGVDSQ